MGTVPNVVAGKKMLVYLEHQTSCYVTLNKMVSSVDLVTWLVTEKLKGIFKICVHLSECTVGKTHLHLRLFVTISALLRSKVSFGLWRPQLVQSQFQHCSQSFSLLFRFPVSTPGSSCNPPWVSEGWRIMSQGGPQSETIQT